MRSNKEKASETLDEAYKLTKKMSGKPISLRVLPMRALNTAILIKQNLEDIPFEELTLQMYFFCKDTEFKDFCHKYEAQIELASADGEKFKQGLYAFYQKMASQILKEDKLKDFLEFLGSCFQLEFVPGNRTNNVSKIIEQYTNLLIGQLEFLRPSKFDFKTMVAGYNEKNHCALTVPDLFPLLDMPAYTVQKSFQMKPTVEEILKSYESFGFHFDRFMDIGIADKLNLTQTLTAAFMSPYITEKNISILPAQPLSIYMDKLKTAIPSSDVKTEELETILTKRKKLLRGNKTTIRFSNSPLKELILMEDIHCDELVLLWKLEFVNEGDTSGIYLSKNKRFMSFFGIAHDNELQTRKLEERTKAFVLWCYASLVCNNESYNIEKIRDSFHFIGKYDYSASIIHHSAAGKNECATGRIGNEKYEEVESNVGFYIRKLPVGQRASEEAKRIAEEMGFDLSLDETFVQSFNRVAYHLKEK